jgi:hypothetical protein
MKEVSMIRILGTGVLLASVCGIAASNFPQPGISDLDLLAATGRQPNNYYCQMTPCSIWASPCACATGWESNLCGCEFASDHCYVGCINFYSYNCTSYTNASCGRKTQCDGICSGNLRGNCTLYYTLDSGGNKVYYLCGTTYNYCTTP